MNYTHLTRAERYQFAIHSKAGHDRGEIAHMLSRHPSTISRELCRNRGQRGYRPKQAHEFSQDRLRARANGPRIAEESWAFVDAQLAELWSPEQICGRLEADGLPSASHEAIYQRIYADQRSGGTLHRALRCQKLRRKRYGGRERRGTIPNRVSIEQRPAIIDSRKRFGDWERGLGSAPRGSPEAATDMPPEEVADVAAARSRSSEGPIPSPVRVLLLRPAEVLRLGAWRRDRGLACFFFMRKSPGLRLRFLAGDPLDGEVSGWLESLARDGAVESSLRTSSAARSPAIS